MASVDDDKFLNEGFSMLSKTVPGGVAQFFDRDYPAEMAKVGHGRLPGIHGQAGQLDRILAKLERARQRIYK